MIKNSKPRTLSRIAASLCVAAAALTATAAHAQVKVQMGAQTIGDYIAAYLAYDEGIFKKHGLDVTLHPVTVSPLATASLVSGSLDVATLSTPDVIQAVDSGIDLVAINGIGVLAATGGTQSGVVAKSGTEIKSAADHAGKKVGVPSVGGLLHIVYQDYLTRNGVKLEDVTFIEIAVPSHLDALKGGSVDAVVTADPMMARILNTKSGHEVLFFGKEVPPNTSTSLLATTRMYASKNPKVIAALRKAWQEATDLALNDHEKARGAMVKYLKLPAPVAATINMPLTLSTKVSPEQLAWWQDIMRKQGLIEGKSSLAPVILP